MGGRGAIGSQVSGRRGYAPSFSWGADTVFFGDDKATVYYLPGTTGWGTTFGGRPTMPWPLPPGIVTPPSTQTAELGAVVDFSVEVTNMLPGASWYRWCVSGFNAVRGTNFCLILTNIQPAQAGAYTVVVSNLYRLVLGP